MQYGKITIEAYFTSDDAGNNASAELRLSIEGLASKKLLHKIRAAINNNLNDFINQDSSNNDQVKVNYKLN